MHVPHHQAVKYPFPYGFPMVSLWFTYGFPVVFLWDIWMFQFYKTNTIYKPDTPIQPLFPSHIKCCHNRVAPYTPNTMGIHGVAGSSAENIKKSSSNIQRLAILKLSSTKSQAHQRKDSQTSDQEKTSTKTMTNSQKQCQTYINIRKKSSYPMLPYATRW